MKRSTSQVAAPSSVYSDWLARLPETKQRMFDSCARQLEACYAMVSIALDAAIAERNEGDFKKSLQVLPLSPPLCQRLTDCLHSMLRSLEQCVTEHGLIPSVTPLKSANFLGLRGKYFAGKSSLVNSVSRTQRSTFLSKVAALRELIARLGEDFCSAAKEIASDGAAVDHPELWTALDKNHFDLNTCMREIVVMLKCVLRVLPDEQLAEFQQNVILQGKQRPESPLHGARVLARQ